MPELTRRDPDAQQATWLIHYGDVRVGVIAERVGPRDRQRLTYPAREWDLCEVHRGRRGTGRLMVNSNFRALRHIFGPCTNGSTRS
jgi:hypothetical protein